MKIRVLGAYGAEGLAQRPSAFLINDTILIDGGTVGGALSSLEQVEHPVGNLWVTPVAVSHTVPCSGFIVHDATSGIVYSGDTGPTDALWKAAGRLKSLRAVILECAFPNRLTALAEVAKHMTPALIRRELDKLPGDVPVLIYHVKPQFHDEIGDELGAIAGHRISFLEQ